MSNGQQLNRSLGLPLVIVVVIGNIIGSGVYKKVAPMAAELHSSGWVLICWVLGGIISLFGALSNAEIAGMLAATGGDYVYYKKIYNRFFAFMFGWSLFVVIQTAAISALAYVFSQSLNSIVPLPPVLSSWQHFNIAGIFYPFANFNVKLTAIILILLLTWLNSRGIKTGARFSAAILILVFAGILTIIIFGLTSQHSHISQAFQMDTTNNTPVTFSAVFTSMLAAFWAYQGWATVGYIGGEVKNQNKNIPRGITIGVFVVIATYLLVNTTYLSLLPLTTLENVHRSQNEVAAIEAVKVFWGQNGGVFISALIAISTLGCAHATILVSCRTYYAMAKEGLFFPKVARVNDAHAPSNSLWYQGAWACILVLSGTFDQLTDMIIFAVFIYYGATTIGVFILRKKMPDAPRPYKVWGYPIVPAIVILFSIALFINTVMSRPREAAIGMGLMLIGIPLWWWFRMKSGRKTQQDLS
jgi:APA family basic amino acid/polyamine antiporter